MVSFLAHPPVCIVEHCASVPLLRVKGLSQQASRMKALTLRRDAGFPALRAIAPETPLSGGGSGDGAIGGGEGAPGGGTGVPGAMATPR